MLELCATKGSESAACLGSSNLVTTGEVGERRLQDQRHLVCLPEVCAVPGHHEFPPYSPDTLRSVYHIRNVEVFKLKQVNGVS